MTPRHPLLLASLALLTGCSATAGQPVSLTAFKAGAMIEGVVKAPKAALEAARDVAGPAKALRLLALRDEAVAAEVPVVLTDARDRYHRALGKPLQTVTDRLGAYRFQGELPKGVPVIVAASLGDGRRVVGLTVPDGGTSRVDLTVAGTLTTEFLRDAAAHDGRGLGDYDRAALAELTALSEGLMGSGEIATPSVAVAELEAARRSYALAVGRDVGGLGDRWATLLGRRVLALETVAGTGVAGGAPDAVPATQAELSRPRAAAANRAGHLFIADEGNHRIRRVDAKTGIISTFAGRGRGAFGGDGGPAAEALLQAPRSVIADDAGNVYVADLLNCRVRRVDNVTGIITTIAGNPAPDGTGGWTGGHAGDGAAARLAKLFAPRGLALDAAGDLFVVDSEADSVYHTVRKIDMKTGIITTAVGTPNAEGAFSGDGNRPEAARLNYPNQIAFDPQGRLVIADTLNHCLRRCDFAGGSITTIAGIGGQKGNEPDGLPADRTRLDTPYGVAVGRDGRIYFSERGQDRVRTIAADGTLRTLAGGGTGAGDGEATRTRLDQPQDLFIEASGDLLIADSRGARIRRLVLKSGF